MKYKNLWLIGTSHIAPESIKEVEDFILKKEPEIVCVELDKSRYKALISGKRKRNVQQKGNFAGYMASLWMHSITGFKNMKSLIQPTLLLINLLQYKLQVLYLAHQAMNW